MKSEEAFNIEDFCGLCAIPDSPYFIRRCKILRDFLTEENKKYNLTRLTSSYEFWIKHIADSLFIVKFFPEIITVDLLIADIGCGAGFPSIVLASAFPNIKVTAVDSSRKKANFVETAGKMLDLRNLSVVTMRAGEMARCNKWTGKFDIITARAVSDSKSLFAEVRNMLKQNGKIILYKTPSQVEKEICEIRKFSAGYGFDWDKTSSFSLPAAAGKRQFLWGYRRKSA